ncbi:PP2C family protein-serine/threonine phosphatase [Marimonas lutisalis]|uniref:PP2C family protein-serine/threonine phosphatase n=1 Tax=Marimonas lutisalis TaxID=2545756 RepID=UPI0010F61554|nr:PP2C family serine/threonine-protein phosphatase [Marimonas lutisalis]
MLHKGEFLYDTATVISQGRRERQEDAIVADFPAGNSMGFVVLSDGMGGHHAGDVASKIVVTEVFSELKLQSGDIREMEHKIGDILQNAMFGANDCVGIYSKECGTDAVMGATLLVPVLIENRLFWLSVGDSPLFLFRGEKLRRLNEDHAIGSQVEYLVSNGLMLRDEALNFPDQNCLTSVIVGDKIPQVDCSAAPVELLGEDILIVASDGLLVLSEDEIAETIASAQNWPAADISTALMRRIEDVDDPFQDNVSICVIKLKESGARPGFETERNNANSSPNLARKKITLVASVSRSAGAVG